MPNRSLLTLCSRMMPAVAWVVLAVSLLSYSEAGGAVRNAARRKHLPLDPLGNVSMKTPENSLYFHDRVIVKLGPSAGTAKAARSFGISSLDEFAQRYSVESISQVFPQASAPGKKGEVDLTRFYVMKYSSPVDPFAVAKELLGRK